MNVKIITANTIKEMEEKLNKLDVNFQLVGNMDFMNNEYVQIVEENLLTGNIINVDSTDCANIDSEEDYYFYDR